MNQTTPTTVTTKQAERLIDFLADKTPSFLCKISTTEDENFTICSKNNDGTFECMGTDDGQLYGDVRFGVEDKILGHDILLGDVLEKIKERPSRSVKVFGLWKEVVARDLIKLWLPLGLTRSLQDIAKDNTEESNALLQFLISIFLTEER